MFVLPPRRASRMEREVKKFATVSKLQKKERKKVLHRDNLILITTALCYPRTTWLFGRFARKQFLLIYFWSYIHKHEYVSFGELCYSCCGQMGQKRCFLVITYDVFCHEKQYVVATVQYGKGPVMLWESFFL